MLKFDLIYIYFFVKFLEATNPDLKRTTKARSSARILRRGKSEDNLDSATHQNHSPSITQSPIPLVEALFLPDFPVRGDIEDQEFEIIEIIAKGAYGNVLKVRREDEKQVYAMKTSVGDHPFIVKLHEYWQSRKCLYIVLDYVPHGDLFTLWTFHGFFPEKLVRVYIAELAMILAPEVLSMTPYGHTADWWSLGILMYAMLTGGYPADGASNHEEMAKKVEDCDYLLPGHISDKAQDLVDRVCTPNTDF
ncbi:hypothetical protein KUTeg_009495 [Tegillarca granosa]|uniref:Protein kinase domain-containing protein n=1 Tax=Tegillarca granosa TaxID=220873 RepID=A0ABQ9F765_TEGGR|nr:hypothetical protein KUTeg_009495 [Tegillarca granosa]